MTAVACKYLRGDRAAVEDVVQNAMLSAFRYRNSFQGRAQRSTWLYRIAANAALMYLRGQRRPSALMLGDIPFDEAFDNVAPPDERSPEEVVGEQQMVTQTLAQLPQLVSKRNYPVVRLRVQGLTEDEVARRLRLPATTVKTRFYRARHQLRTRRQAE